MNDDLYEIIKTQGVTIDVLVKSNYALKQKLKSM